MSQIKTENINWLKIRALMALFGISLLLLGQAQINSQGPSVGLPLPWGIWLNQHLHLGDPHIDQVLNALPLLCLGGLFLTIALRGMPLLTGFQNTFNETPLSFRLLRSTWQWLFIGIGIFIFFVLRLGSPGFITFEVPLWLISLSLITIAVALWDRNRKIDLSPHISRLDLLWMLGLLAAGVVIGAYRLQGLPDQLIGDDGSFWTIARDIALNKFQPSIFAPGVYSFPVFSSIIQAWFLEIFGISLWGWRFSSVLTGLAALFPLYLLACEMFDRKIAILSSIALITGPYFIDFSRLGYNNIQALFFTTLTLYWLYIGLYRRSSLYLFLAGCMAGLCFYTYFAARGALVISVLFILLVWLGKKIKSAAILQAVAALGLGFVLVVTPYFIYGRAVDPQGLSYKSFESAFFNSFNGLQFYSNATLYSVAPPIEINGNQLFYNPRIYAVLITRGFIRTMLAFQKSGLISEHFIAFPLAGTMGAIFYLIGLVLMIATARQTRSLLLLIWFFVNIFGFSALNTVPPRQTHMVAIIPALAILTAVGLNAMANVISTMHNKLGKYRLLILSGLMAVTVAGGLYDFFVRVPVQYHAQPGEVISWAALESNNDSIVYLYSDPSQSDFVPYAKREIRKNIPYEAVSAGNVINGSKIFTSLPTLVFYTPDVATAVNAALQKQWGIALSTRTFYSTAGDPVLIAGMNTPFVFEEYKDGFTIFKDSYLNLPLVLLLVFILGCFLLVFFIPKTRILKIPAPLKRLLEWLQAPPAPHLEDETSDWNKEILLASSEQKKESNDPPDWAFKSFLPDPDPKSNRFQVQANSIKIGDGTDHYIQIHVPRLLLPRFRFPGSIRENDVSESKTGSLLPPLTIPDPALLIGGIASAIIAQILISGQLTIYGILAYGVCLVSLIVWARLNPKWRNIFSHQLNLTSRLEAAALGISLLITIFTRYYDLNYRVYGLEADETKWTVQSWYSTILRVDLGEFATMHYVHLPVDFWLRSVFLRLFGLNFISARIESATLSLIAVICLYFLVRILTNNSAVALLASALYGFSFIELNASHQALHDTHPAGWMVASLFFLVWAIQDRKLWKFQVTGILLALGMLTYETFFPTPMIAALYLAGLAIYEIVRKRESAWNWVRILVVVFWPVAIAYFGYTHVYLSEQAYHFNGFTDALGSGMGQTVGFIWKNLTDILKTTFKQVVWTDSLINWSGPLLNPLILPFVVIGFVYNLWNLRRPQFAFILLWYIGQMTPAPLMLGSAWPRIMYMSLAPLMIWAALGLWTTFAALRALFDNFSLKLAAPVFCLMILVILLNDYHIFTSQLTDPIERQKRRDLADLTYSSAASTPMILFPYMPNQDDTFEVESHVLLYAVAGARHIGLDAANYYKQLTQATLLPTLWQLKSTDGIDIFYDKTANSFQDDHLKAFQGVLNCYPHAVLKSSDRFFNVYHLGSQDLGSPHCYSPAKPFAILPGDNLKSGDGQPIILHWDTNNVNTSSFSITLERKLENIFWIEAENFQGPGWHPESRFVNDFYGSGFLLDDEHAGQANYDFNVPVAGRYKVWVRSYKRRVNDQHNFIGIAGQKLEFAVDESPLNGWVWMDMGMFDLPAGPLPLSLTRTYGTDEQYSVFIDTIVITSDLDYQPGGEDSEWRLVTSTGEINSTVSMYPLGVDLLPGEYRWKVRVFDGDRIVDSTGVRGIESDVNDFIIH